MMWISGTVQQDEVVAQSGDVPATRGAVLRSVAGETLDTNPTGLLARYIARQADEALALSPVITAEQAQDRYGLDGALTFDGPVSEYRAQELYQFKRQELLRQSLLARGPRGLVGELAVGFAAALYDPLSVAASVVPGGAPARFATTGSRLSYGAMASRSVVSARNGAIGAAAVEGVVLPLALDEQRDYTYGDSLLNVLFGGGLGLVGGGLAGYLDVRRSRRLERNAPIEAVEAASPEARQAAMTLAIDQALRGETVQLDPVFEPYLGRVPSKGEIELNGRPVRVYAEADAIAPNGSEARVRYAIVEADSLITSNDDDLRINADYPQELQPRDRTRVDSALQVQDMAANLDPRRLGHTADAGSGAPIIGRDGVVESGNGRTLSVRRAYNDFPEKAEAYQKFIERLGYETSGFEKPVLVRLRTDGEEMATRARFARDANRRTTSSFSPSEQARADAAQLTPDLVELYGGGGPDLAANRRFAAQFIDRVVGAEERGSLIDAQGELSPDGMRRINQALVAYAYEDLALISRMSETGNPGMRSIGNALQVVAPDFAFLRARIERGDLAAENSPVPFLIEALGLVREARKIGSLKALVAQNDAFSREWSAEAIAFAQIFYRDDGLKKPLSQAKISSLLKSLVSSMLDEADTDLLGEFNVTRGTLSRVADSLDAKAREFGGSVGEDFERLAIEVRSRERSGGDGSRGRRDESAAQGSGRDDQAPAGGVTDPAVGSLTALLERMEAGEAARRDGGMPPEVRVQEGSERLSSQQMLDEVEAEIASVARLAGEDPPSQAGQPENVSEMLRAAAFCIRHHGDAA